MRMLAEDELRDAVLLVFANKQVQASLPPSFCSLLSAPPSCTCLLSDWSPLILFPYHLIVFRTCLMPWTLQRSQTSWACTPYATATGTSRPPVPPAVTASTRAWTGWPISWRTKSEGFSQWSGEEPGCQLQVVVIVDPLCLHGEAVLKSSQGVTLNGFLPPDTFVLFLYLDSFDLFGSAVSVFNHLETTGVEVDLNDLHSISWTHKYWDVIV